MKEKTQGYSQLIRKIQKKEKRQGKIRVYFTDTKEMRRLNRKFRKIDRSTDVLSFEIGDKEDLGEIVISDKEKEIKRLVVHGVLHLVGYDHINKKDRDIMRAKEELYIKWAC